MEVAVVVVAVEAVHQEFQAFLVVLVPRDQLVWRVPQGTKVTMDLRARKALQEKRATQEIKEDKAL